jgi:hypothetical protein
MWLTGRLIPRPQDNRRLPQGEWASDEAGPHAIY